MRTISHLPYSAIRALQSTAGFLKSVYHLETLLDEIRIAESTLTKLIDGSSYFQEEFFDQLETTRDLAGACIAQVCHAAQIPGYRHCSDSDDSDPLAGNYHRFLSQYYGFLTGLCHAADKLAAQAEEALAEQDLALLCSLTAPLSLELVLIKAHLDREVT
jgi:hypothetical protein